MTTGERTGRPAGGDGRNKARILAAAREEFATRGFRGATMRSIAAQAGVDVALLSHYFGSKDGLFTATIELPDGAQRMLADALSGPIPTQGLRLTRGYLGLWEDSATGGQMQVLVRSALSNEAASARLDGLLAGTIAAPEVEAAVAGRRTGLMLGLAHLVGVAIARHLVQVPQVAELDFDTLVARVAPAVQLHLGAVD